MSDLLGSRDILHHRDFGCFGQNRTFSTSLTTSVVSRDLGFHFCKSVHTFPSVQTHWLLRESNGLYFFDDLHPTAWLGPVFFIMAVG